MSSHVKLSFLFFCHLCVCDTTVPQSYTDTTIPTEPSLPGRPEHPAHALVAGAVGGYFVWGQWSALSHQVLMYVSIRVLAGLGKLVIGQSNGDDGAPSHWRTQHRLAATSAWAAVMYLWETRPDVVQPSMRKSMDEIYDSGWLGLPRQSPRRASG